MKKVKENPNLVKDDYSKAVINIDSNKLITAKMAKKARQDKLDRLNKVEEDITEIKSLLNDLISTIKKSK